jgi:hypothetical protein
MHAQVLEEDLVREDLLQPQEKSVSEGLENILSVENSIKQMDVVEPTADSCISVTPAAQAPMEKLSALKRKRRPDIDPSERDAESK